MATEALAAVAADLREGRFLDIYNVGSYASEVADLAGAVIVDVTDLFNTTLESEGTKLYEQRLAPPWSNALLMYENTFGNVVAVHVVAYDAATYDARWQPQDLSDTPPGADHVIDWEVTRWVLSVSVWLGGKDGNGVAIRTSGPHLLWGVAVDGDGVAQDINWIDVTRGRADVRSWDNALSTWLRAYNFLACRNVTVGVPSRERAERRRIERAGRGAVIHELAVLPTGKSMARASNARKLEVETAAHSVRGHFAEYGANGKGLLFGKLAGRFFIPQHARGSADVGEVTQHFTLLRDKDPR